MKFELDNADIKVIGWMANLMSDLPLKLVGDRRSRTITKLLSKINSQIPDKQPENATRRIRTFNEKKET